MGLGRFDLVMAQVWSQQHVCLDQSAGKAKALLGAWAGLSL